MAYMAQMPEQAPSPKKVTAESFFSAWKSVCTPIENQLYRDWDELSKYSGHVFNGEASIIARVAERLSLKAYLNYYWLDAVLYNEPNDLVPEAPPQQTWFRHIQVAFEHENKFSSGLFKEISHLMITDCDLRVLVSYPGPKDNPDEELAYLNKIISGSSRSPRFAANRDILVIFGELKQGVPLITWTGLVYTSTKWSLIS
jgi:hypothetical protein